MRTVPAIVTVSLNPAIDRVIEVPDFTIGAHQEGREVSRTAGGKAVNVSRVLAALGVPSIATGFLGRENYAGFEQILKDPSVKDEFFLLPGRTRENVTITDPATGRETHIRDVGLEVSAPARERLTKKLRLLCSRRPIVIFSGSLPPGISVEVFAELVSACVSAGARVAVDASGEALAAMAGSPLWLVKPNAAELEQLLGRELPTEQQRFQAARELTSHVQFVLLSRGQDGACLFASDLAVSARVPFHQEQVINTVGCGDTLLGAFVAGTWRGLPPREALRDAVACASASACNIGSATFDDAVLEEFRQKADLTEI